MGGQWPGDSLTLLWIDGYAHPRLSVINNGHIYYLLSGCALIDIPLHTCLLSAPQLNRYSVAQKVGVRSSGYYSSVISLRSKIVQNVARGSYWTSRPAL